MFIDMKMKTIIEQKLSWQFCFCVLEIRLFLRVQICLQKAINEIIIMMVDSSIYY